MANPLSQMLNSQPTNNILQRFQQFRQSFKGDPQQTIQQLLQSGKVTQEQYDKAVQMAQQFKQLIK